MSHYRRFAAAVFMACLAAAAMATSNFVGVTGLLLTPTPDTVGNDAYNVFAYHVEDADNLTYGFNYGLQPNLEVGFSRLAGDGTIVNFKYNFQPETTEKPGLAIGIIDLTDEFESTLYVVGSKTFPEVETKGISNFRAYAGLAGQGNVFLDSLFAGVSVDVGNRVTAMVEHDGNELNFGAKFALTPSFVIQAGAVGEDRDVVFGANYVSAF